MFKQITNSAEPKVIGVNNGVYQVEIDESYLESREDYDLIETLFLLPEIKNLSEYNQQILNLEINVLKGKLLKRAKLTDIMGFSPYFFSCEYIVSGAFLNCLEDLKIDKNEYRIFTINLEGIDDPYYLLFVPAIKHEEIIFSKSLICPSVEKIEKGKSYFKVDSYEDYQDLIKRSVMNKFEKVTLPSEYDTKDIISIQGIGYLYFSERLFQKMISTEISSFLSPQNEVELVFA